MGGRSCERGVCRAPACCMQSLAEIEGAAGQYWLILSRTVLGVGTWGTTAANDAARGRGEAAS